MDGIRRGELTLRQAVIGVFVLYALLTLLSSGLALASGMTHDTHVHLLLRFGMTSIGVGAFYLYGQLRRRLAGGSPVLLGLTTYALALAAAMSGVWLYGRVDTLHPDAYRDMFLNFTGIAIGLSAVWGAFIWRAHRGTRTERGHGPASAS